MEEFDRRLLETLQLFVISNLELSSQRDVAPNIQTRMCEIHIYRLLFNHSSHLNLSHSNSNSRAASRCTVAQMKKRGILALFNLTTPLKQLRMSGTRTKSGVRRLRRCDGKWVTFCVCASGCRLCVSFTVIIQSAFIKKKI